MLSSYLLIAMAAVSHAFLFQPREEMIARRGPWRTNLDRRGPGDPPPRGDLAPNGTLANPGQRTKTYCPADASSSNPNLDTLLLGSLEKKARIFCGEEGQTITRSDDTKDPGAVFSIDGGAPFLQICSTEKKEPFKCTFEILGHMLDEIACGSRELPTQGFGTVVDGGQTVPEKYYVWYGNDPPGPCLSTSDFLGKKWNDDSQYYGKNQGNSGSGGGGGGGNGGTGDHTGGRP